jgi:hypothetical protein
MNPGFLAYSEFAGFWARFSPETPFGREERDRMEVLRDAPALEALWDLTEEAGTLLGLDPVTQDRITHHLKRLPRFPQDPRPVYGEVELFQFKKFLFNYRSLLELLPPRILQRFSLSFASDLLLRQLDLGRQSAESFYVSDDYSQELKAVRAEIRSVDEAARDARCRRAEEIRRRWGIEFGNREFALVPREAVADPAGLLLVEPYDDLHHLVRPQRGPEELVLAERRSELRAREGALEEGVLESLSHMARQELGRLEGYRKAVTAFDLALARARLARQFGLVRPVLGEGAVALEGARFLPCEEACGTLGTPYVPLDAAFQGGATVVFGSNMGGKTIVLKTLAFLQLCAQTGLFVPARAFRTRVFRSFHYVGEGGLRGEELGLSGFGREIQRFTEAWRDFGGPTLALFDEFARTTQSREAEAILSSVLEALAPRTGVLALFSTHFRGVARVEGVAYRRMKGLDRARLAREDGGERIQAINRSMDYHLVDDEGRPAASDAITVAEVLGLDPDLARRAEHFYQEP